MRGRSIPPLPVKVVKLPKKKKPVDPVPVKPRIDPRTLPLPYPAFRKQLLALLGDRKYDAAKKHVQAGLASGKLAKDRNLIAWDKQDVERTAAFWDDLKRAVAKMKPGDTFSIGPVRVEFISFSAGTFVAFRVQRVRRSVDEEGETLSVRTNWIVPELAVSVLTHSTRRTRRPDGSESVIEDVRELVDFSLGADSSASGDR